MQESEGQDGQQDTLLTDRLLQAARTARRFEYPFGMPHYIEYLVRRYKAGDFHRQPKVPQGGTQPQPEDSPKIAQDSSLTQKNSQTQMSRQSVSASPKAAPQALPPDWYLTADSALSAQAELLLRAQLKNNPQARVHNGAILVIENATGNILAWIGSNSYFDDENNGKIDGVTALNQSGSSSKPFLYALALEQGWKPSDVLPDIPIRFGKEEAYIPRNFNNRFNGPVRLRVALASSLNIPAVYLLNELGIETYLHTLEELGFQSIGTDGAEAKLSLALGSVPVPLPTGTRVQRFSTRRSNPSAALIYGREHCRRLFRTETGFQRRHRAAHLFNPFRFRSEGKGVRFLFTPEHPLSFHL